MQPCTAGPCTSTCAGTSHSSIVFLAVRVAGQRCCARVYVVSLDGLKAKLVTHVSHCKAVAGHSAAAIEAPMTERKKWVCGRRHQERRCEWMSRGVVSPGIRWRR